MDRLERATLDAFITRFESLKPDTKSKWGKLTPIRLLRHIRYTIEISLGEVVEPDKSNFLMRHVGRILVFHIFTHWPGGTIKAPGTWTPAPEGDFSSEHKKLTDALERFVESAEREPKRKTVSPLLGPLTLAYWRHIHGVHIAHHFRQFRL